MPDDKFFPCPCCGENEIYEPGCYEICENCGWEDDPVQQKKPDTCHGANKMTLSEAKKAYAEGRKVNQ